MKKLIVVGRTRKAERKRVPLPVWRPKQESGMSPKDIEDIASQIRYHNKKYWIEHSSEISDPEYDKLVEKLRKAAPFHPALDEMTEDNSEHKEKINHAVPMLSLEKVFTAKDIVDWAQKAGALDGKADDGIVCSYKIDGSSCTLMYENGKLKYAATRGNGVEGDDVTANVKTIAGIPKTIPSNKTVEVRGEIYMTLASFNEAIEAFEERLKKGEVSEDDRPKNPRNYCAGSLKQKDPEITRKRKLSFMAHNCVMHGGDFKQTSEFEVLKAMQKLGFETPLVCLIKNPTEVETAIQKIGTERKSLPYETDGVVFGINRLSIHKQLGSTSHHPRYRIAFKFARERGETVVVAINWETSRTGRCAPVMQVKPIELGGATVTLCTLHHAKTIRETKLAIGDTVLLEREVIPYFVEKTKDSGNSIKLPTHCNSCNSELEWDETETHLVCPNSGGCPNQQLSYLEHYVSRKVCNMMGIGSELIEKLVQVGLVKSPADLYKLTPDQILKEIPRQGETSAKKAVTAIQERREQTLGVFLQSLGIEKLGETVSERVAEKFGTLDMVLAASEDELMGVEKVAEGIAKAVHKGLRQRKSLIVDLCKHVVIKKVEKVDGPLSGKSFCLTGHVEVEFDGKKLDSRPDIEDLIKAKGGTIKSVSKNLSFLIAGEGSGDKLEKAKKFGLKVIDGIDFAKMLEKA